jgi:hypothetical protein
MALLSFPFMRIAGFVAPVSLSLSHLADNNGETHLEALSLPLNLQTIN